MKCILPFRQHIHGASIIYGGSVDVLELSDEVATAVGIGFESEVYPFAQYNRNYRPIISESADFRDTIEKLFSTINCHFDHGPASIALNFKDCIVSSGVIHLPLADGLAVVQPTYRENDRPFVSPLTDIDIESIERFEAPGRKLIYFGSAGSHNYGHWLVDDLTRLKHVLDRNEPTTLLLQSRGDISSIHNQSLSLLLQGRDVQIKTISPTHVLRCQDLTYITPVSYHPYAKNPPAINWLRVQITNRLRPESNAPKRLFVRRNSLRKGTLSTFLTKLIGWPRRHIRGRQISNLSDIEACAKAAGFYICDPESMSFEAQMTLFAGAEIVVGTMGAAMCNTVACRAGVKLLYLLPEGWVEPFYWDMAEVLSHDYFAISGHRENIAAAAHDDDFRIDVASFKAALADLDR